MKARFCTLVCASALLTTPALATESQDYSSWYAGVNVQAYVPNSNKVSGTSSGTLDYAGSFTGNNIVIGYRPEALYTPTGDFRFEGEVSSRTFGIHKATADGTVTRDHGTLDVWALMANGYYDLHTSTSFTPFIGGGLGVAAAAFSDDDGFQLKEKASDTALLAGQFTLGVSYVPQAWPHTDWSLAYNYFVTSQPEFLTKTGHIRLDDLSVNGLELGFKYHF